MITRRNCLLFAALCFSLAASPSGFAEDAHINKQIAKIKRCLTSSDEHPVDLKGLKAAAFTLTQIWPAVLDAVPQEQGKKEYEVDSATGDVPSAPRLELTEHQRLALLNAYQDYAENIAAIAGHRPFDQQATDQIKGAVAALEQFIAKLNSLLPMDPNSAEYKKAVETLVNEEQPKNK